MTGCAEDQFFSGDKSDNIGGDENLNTFPIFGSDSTFSVVTWNIQLFPKHSVYTINLLAKMIVDLNVNILGLQEITNSSDFNQHVATKIEVNLKEKPLFLYCSRKIVNSYLEIKGETFRSEVEKYVGDFATQKYLESVSSNNLVFFGNHLYNHDVPLLLTDDELLESYRKNEDELKKHPNSRSLFAFPFGQPDTCFSKRQIELLIKNGAKKVFSSDPLINSEVTAQYLHRIPLNSFNNTKATVWFNIMRKSIGL